MNAKHGAAIAGVVVVLAAIVLLATWPQAGHPDDARDTVDAGTALAPSVEPTAPEEPSPAPTLPPPVSAPPASALLAPPPSGTAAPPSVAPSTPSLETFAGPPFDDAESYEAANALVSAIEARRIEVAAALADAQRRGDARLVARLTQQRDGLSTSLERAQSIVSDMERDRHATPAPSVEATDLPVGP